MKSEFCPASIVEKSTEPSKVFGSNKGILAGIAGSCEVTDDGGSGGSAAGGGLETNRWGTFAGGLKDNDSLSDDSDNQFFAWRPCF